jgi:hypothetical protein
MSPSEPQPDDARTAELVAYLDGELPEDAARRIEQQLATDDEYRRQLGELDQAWSALEALPTATVDDKFARTTIEMVAVAAEKDLTHRSATETADRRRRMLKFAAGGLATIAVGFVAARLIMPSQNRALIADLPTIARIDELTQIGDIGFLRGLSHLDIQQFTSDDDSRTRPIEFEIPIGSWDNPEDRRRWVEHLASDQKAELAGRLQRFESLPGGPGGQRQMRDLEEQIAQADDSATLERTMAAYSQWLSGQKSGEQALLREGSAAQRLQEVKRLLKQDNREAGHKLTPEEEQRVRAAVNAFADQHRSELMEQFRRFNPDAARRAEKQPKFVNMMATWLSARDEKLRDELQTQVKDALNESNRAYLESLKPFEQARRLGRWVWEATSLKVGPEELERFFSETLTNDEREELLNLPQAEFQSQLERWYAASQLGIPKADWATFDNSGRFGRMTPAGPNIDRPRDRGEGPRGREGPPPRGERRSNRGPGDGLPDGPPPGGPPRGDRSRPGPPPDEPDGPPPGPPPR